MNRAATTVELIKYLTELHLPTVKGCYHEQAEDARRSSFSYEMYLHQVMEREIEDRRHRRKERLLKESHLPLEKTLSSFDRSRLPQKVNAQFSVLLEGDFVSRRENVLAFGNPGSAKPIFSVLSVMNSFARAVQFSLPRGRVWSRNS